MRHHILSLITMLTLLLPRLGLSMDEIIPIWVKSIMGGNYYMVECGKEWKIRDIKRELFELHSVDINGKMLLVGGMALDDNKTIKELNLERESIMFITSLEKASDLKL
jgi:hypothetical protein